MAHDFDENWFCRVCGERAERVGQPVFDGRTGQKMGDLSAAGLTPAGAITRHRYVAGNGGRCRVCNLEPGSLIHQVGG